MRNKTTIAAAAAAGLIAAGLAFPGIFAANAAPPPISPVTRVPGQDASTQIGLAWHTARVTSGQPPETRLSWGPAGGFTCSYANWDSAVKPVLRVDGGVGYAKAFLSQLTPGASYQYCVLSALQTQPITSSLTMPVSNSASTTFLAFADAAWSSTASANSFRNTVESAQSQYPGASFMTHNGILTSTDTDLARWDGFLEHAAPVLDRMAWAPTQSYNANIRFAHGTAVPLEGTTNNSGFYAVRDGQVLVLVINTYVTTNIAAVRTFIQQQTSNVSADTWVVASVPTQIYGASATSSTYLTGLKQAFSDAKVALVLQGGSRAYTRSWPITSGASTSTVFRDYPGTATVATKDGTVYVTPGASGADLATVPAAALTGSSSWLAVASPNASGTATQAAKKSYSVITATPSELKVAAQMVDGTKLDEFTINRGSTPAYEPRPLALTGLNNSFGTDAKTSRTITWLGLATAGYTNPYYKIVPAGQNIDAAPAITAGCNAPARMVSALSTYNSYTCQVSGLSAGTTYTYKVGAQVGARPYESKAYSFATELGLDKSEFKFLDLADSQGGAANYSQFWGQTLTTATKNHPDAVLVTQSGDIVDDTTAAHLTGWLAGTGDSLANVAFNPVLGNHDSASAAQPMWKALFPRDSVTRYSGSGALQYAQIYRNALFLHINTNLESVADLNVTEQWVKETVKANGFDDGDVGKFIIVVEHKSPFGGSHANGNGTYPQGSTYTSRNLIDRLPRIYSEAGVDLVLAGHDHSLVRSLPIQWSPQQNKAVWDRANLGLTTINSDTDGLVYFIPHQAADKGPYSITLSQYPWIAKYTSPARALNNNAYAVVTVSQDAIRVNTYFVGDPVNPVDSFSVVQGYPDPTVLASSSTISIGGRDTGLAVTVSTNQKTWSASSAASWLSVTSTGADGALLTMTAQPNPLASPRTAVVTLRAGTATSTVTLTQGPAS